MNDLDFSEAIRVINKLNDSQTPLQMLYVMMDCVDTILEIVEKTGKGVHLFNLELKRQD